MRWGSNPSIEYRWLRTLHTLRMEKQAYATMVVTSDYVTGALVMAHSLRHSGNASRPLLCIVTKEVESRDRATLQAGGMTCIEVDSMAAPSPSGVGEWDKVGYTKLNLWGLEQYEKLLYIDADCLVQGNLEDLWQRDTDFAAAPDTFPPDRFNAGVMLLRPSISTLEEMKSKIESLASYDGGDTGFLNAFFPSWFEGPPSSRLPFRYNALRTMYHMTKKKPTYWAAVGSIAIVHYCSFPKPWEKSPSDPLETLWWTSYATCQLTLRMKGKAVPQLRPMPVGGTAVTEMNQTNGDGASMDEGLPVQHH